MSRTIAVACLFACAAITASAQPRYYPNSATATARDTSFVVSAGERRNLSIGWNCFEEGPAVVVMFTKRPVGGDGTVPLEYGVPEGAPQPPIALPVIDARRDILPSIFGADSPFAPFSTTKPRMRPSWASDFAQTTKTSAMGEFEIQVLFPFRR